MKQNPSWLNKPLESLSRREAIEAVKHYSDLLEMFRGAVSKLNRTIDRGITARGIMIDATGRGGRKVFRGKKILSRLDFRTESERAKFVNDYGLAAYMHLPKVPPK